jgi:yeast amino acid transporter
MYISDKDWREAGFKKFLTDSPSGYLAGFWACVCQAAYTYAGSDIVGITASEAESPRRTLSKAVRKVSWRLSLYYIGAAFVLGLNLSPNDPQLVWYLQSSYKSPFVLMIQRAGIPGLAHLLNAVCVIAATSVANANLYETV